MKRCERSQHLEETSPDACWEADHPSHTKNHTPHTRTPSYEIITEINQGKTYADKRDKRTRAKSKTVEQKKGIYPV